MDHFLFTRDPENTNARHAVQGPLWLLRPCCPMGLSARGLLEKLHSQDYTPRVFTLQTRCRLMTRPCLNDGMRALDLNCKSSSNMSRIMVSCFHLFMLVGPQAGWFVRPLRLTCNSHRHGGRRADVVDGATKSDSKDGSLTRLCSFASSATSGCITSGQVTSPL